MKAQCRLYRRNYHNFKSNKYATLTANLILVNEKDKEMRKLQVWPLFAQRPAQCWESQPKHLPERSKINGQLGKKK